MNNKKSFSQWKQNRFCEAELLGYIKKKAVNRDNTGVKYIVDMVKSCACLLLVNVFTFVPFYRVFKMISYRSRGDVLWERTALGNEMAERIAGLFRFIHEFSLLSEAKKEQVALWDDYLVYAIVLEENEQLLNEISKQYKINVQSFDRLRLNRK